MLKEFERSELIFRNGKQIPYNDEFIFWELFNPQN